MAQGDAPFPLNISSNKKGRESDCSDSNYEKHKQKNKYSIAYVPYAKRET